MRVFSIILLMKAGDLVTIWVFYSRISSEEFRNPVQLLPPAGQLLSMQGHMEDSCGYRPLFMSSTVVDYVTWNWGTPYKFIYKFAMNIFQWWKPCFCVWYHNFLQLNHSYVWNVSMVKFLNGLLGMERIDSEIRWISFDKPRWNEKVLYKGSPIRMPKQKQKRHSYANYIFFFINWLRD